MFDMMPLLKEAYGVDEERLPVIPNGPALLYLYRRYGPSRNGSDDYKEICRYLLPTTVKGLGVAFGIKGKDAWVGVAWTSEVMWRYVDEHRQPLTAWHERCKAWAAAQGTPLLDAEEGDLEGIEHGAAMALWKQRNAAADANNPPIRETYAAQVEPWPDLGDPANHSPFVRECHEAVKAVLLDQLRPVGVRDTYINILGDCDMDKYGGWAWEDEEQEEGEYKNEAKRHFMAGYGVVQDVYRAPDLYFDLIKRLREIGEGDVVAGMRAALVALAPQEA
jgi:hypothetical protein